MKIKVFKVNSFTSDGIGGNPAGVVLQSNRLNTDQMKKISQLLEVSETAFVYPSFHADYQVRFFSPAIEVDLCGHATIATFTILGKKKHTNNENMIELTQETKAGILPVRIYYKDSGEFDYVLMRQQKPVFESVSYDPQELADMLNISVDDCCFDLPQQRVSTGLFTLPIRVSSFQILKDMKPNFKLVKHFCQKLQVGSVHLFTLDTIESDSLYHARNFAPVYDVKEDPVTGTANGAVCSYLRHHHLTSLKKMICEQGDIIEKPGRVQVSFINDHVWVGGNALVEKSVELTV